MSSSKRFQGDAMSRNVRFDSNSLLQELLVLTSPFVGKSFFAKATEALSKAFAADWVFIARAVDDARQRVRVLGAWQEDAPMACWEFSLNGTPCGAIYNVRDVAKLAIVKNETVLVADGLGERFAAAANTPYRAFIGLPLYDRQHRMAGHIALFFKKPLTDQECTAPMNAALSLLARRAEAELHRLDIEREREAALREKEKALAEKEQALAALEVLNSRLYRESITDSLTGLYNRRYFNQRCREAYTGWQRSGKCYAVLVVDVDYFKRINDSFGHDAGDEVLKAVAAALQQSVRTDLDIVARLGGEEFGILCCDIDSQQAVMHIGERILATVTASNVALSTGAVRVSVSAGCAKCCLDDDGWEDAYRRADAALYQAKSDGRNLVRMAA